MHSGPEKARALDQRAIILDDVQSLGSMLILAPHPDDESLGCGGTIIRLRQAGLPVYVVFVSDGSMSHPNSPTYPAGRLRDLRETEAREALSRLGVSADACTFMRLPDTAVPFPDQQGFAEAVATLVGLIEAVHPATILVPWERDPHRDHRATWQLLQTARTHLTMPTRVLEYLIWLWELGRPDDMPRPDERRVWKVPIDTVIDQRNRAIAAHASQVTRLIDDDPTAFYLSPELLTHFERPYELFLEV
ncbi:PIG-L deacetylase family protein [Spirosoma rhododendri]|uniref:PIG-L family deacetylase n=1 Tax=Spirosoma rhododendri TaxID=2728024 RepID=A0A7L5DVM4_9BACT|nr:PIG-L deacetylase family protein [Spirosoma rhododendri]QJD80017.1 PIG-L family deacetylase [Spirosoma rhododendri]